MLTILLAVLPVFSREIITEDDLVVVGCIEQESGYFAVMSRGEEWNSRPKTYLLYTDRYGTGTLGYYYGSTLEPLDVFPFAEKSTMLFYDWAESSTKMYQIGGGSAVFQGQFEGGVHTVSPGEELTVAGNDSPGDGPVRVAVTDSELNVLSNQLYPSCVMDVAGAACINGETCILGSSEQSGWQRDMVLFFPGTMEEYHFQPQTGRFTPAGIQPLEDGCLVVSSAMTEANGMIGEIFVMRLSTGMEVQWTASLGGDSWMNASSTTSTGQGMVMTGWTNSLPFSESNRADLLMAEFSSDGDLLWTREYGGGTPDYGLSVNTCSDGGFIVSGCFCGELYNGLLLRTDSTGSIEAQGISDQSTPARFLWVQSNPSRDGVLGVLVGNVPPEGVQVSVMDMAGRVVRNTHACSGNVTFHGLPSGSYVVLANNGNTTCRTSAVILGGSE